MAVQLHQDPRLPRRAILTGAGAALLAGTLALNTPAAHTPLVEWPQDLRERWVEIITARARLGVHDRRVHHHLRAEASDVREFLRSASDADAGAVFPEYPFDGESSGSLSGTATRLAAMARAWTTTASPWSQDERLHGAILEGLEKLLENGYSATTHPYDNWWDWEIGTPRPLADLLCIMHGELPSGMLEAAANAIRAFVPDPTYSQLMNYPTTASNRVGTTQGALIAAVAEGDEERMKTCVEALPEAWGMVKSADGFYADGSFIQHINVAYTGSYGVELLRGAVPLLRLIENTDLDTIDQSPLWDRVDESFLPVMVSGHLLDAVRGRAVARVRTSGSTGGRAAAAAIAELGLSAPASRREPWFALIRQWADANDSVDVLAGADVPGAVALAEISDAPAVEAPKIRSHFFSSMDRLVHRAPGWTAAIAMSSNRIASFEASEAENVWGSLTGNAMRYVYVDDDPTPFDDHFWATLDYSRPPGTTNHGIALEPRSTRDGNNVPENEWTGGLVHGEHSIAAMHQLGFEDDAPECRRLIIGAPDRLIELVSDIKTERRAFTTVENRMAPAGEEPRLIIDSRRIRRETREIAPGWAHLEGTGGYVFLTGSPLRAEVTTRAGSAQRVEREVGEIPAEHRVDRRWARLDLEHGGTPAAWMLLPGASRESTELEARSPTATVGIVRNDATGQVVAIGDDITVAAAWSPLTIYHTEDVAISFPHALLALVERADDGIVLRITEPTQQRETSRIRVTGRWALAEHRDIHADEISTAAHGELTELIMDTADRRGACFMLRLRQA